MRSIPPIRTSPPSRQSETDRVTGDVTDAKGLLSDIASLNQQISQLRRPSSRRAAPWTCAIARQAKIESLSQKMNVEVTTFGGPSRVQVQISVPATRTATAVPLVDKTTVVGDPLSFDGHHYQFLGTNGQSTATSLNITGGSIAGELQARDGVVASLRSDLKTLAGQLTSAVNSAYNPGGKGANFFAASPSGGKLIDVDAATTADTLHAGSTGDAGANDIALAVAGLATKTFSKTGGDAVNGTLGDLLFRGGIELRRGNLRRRLAGGRSGAHHRADREPARCGERRFHR